MVNNTAVLPEPAEAYDKLFGEVHSEVFMGKLANAGIAPQTEKEAEDLFMLAGRLRHLNVEKKASSSRFGGALAALDKTLQSNAGYRQSQASNGTVAIKQAAANLMNDPAIYASVLSLKAQEARQLAGEE